MSDQRCEPRAPVFIPIRFRNGSELQLLQGNIIDLSEKGLRLTTTEALPKDASVSLDIEVMFPQSILMPGSDEIMSGPERIQSAYVHGRVIYSKHEDAKWHSGIVLEKNTLNDPTTLIREYIQYCETNGQ